jgi:Tfp pilus assembly protein PilZ
VAEERRGHLRKASQISVDYVANGRLHRSFIKNISSGGAFIATSGVVSCEQEILIAFNHPGTRMDVFVVGRIARVDPSGIGVRFKRMADDRERAFLVSYSGSANTAEEKGEGENMGRIRKKRMHWEPSASPEVVKYRLYWSEGSIVGYTSKYFDVGQVTEVVLPDEVPSFPMMRGEVTFGVTAFNEAGNESDISEVTAQIDFVVPQAPGNLSVEDV